MSTVPKKKSEFAQNVNRLALCEKSAWLHKRNITEIHIQQ